MDAAKTYNHDCFILAGQQLAGRGKPGSAWQSARGDFFCSLRLTGSLGYKYEQLSVVFCVLLGQVVLSLNPDLSLVYKHPNDLYINRRKLSGVLVERYGSYSIIGMGLNLAKADEVKTCLLEYGINISPLGFLNRLRKIRYQTWQTLERQWSNRLMSSEELLKVKNRLTA